MEEMEKETTNRLIKWLEKHNHTNDEIVDCIKFITEKQSTEKTSESKNK